MSVKTGNYNFFFKPRNIAVIGASRQPGKVGYDSLKNLIDDSFGGDIYPVNPVAPDILGLKAYKTVGEINDDIDLALVAVPAELVVDIFKELIEKKVKGAVVVSAGFRELGGEGMQRESELAEMCRGKIRVIGPNCLGIIDTYSNLNASFAPTMLLSLPLCPVRERSGLSLSREPWSLLFLTMPPAQTIWAFRNLSAWATKWISMRQIFWISSEMMKIPM